MSSFLLYSSDCLKVGACGVVAKQMGYFFIGIEVNKEMYASAKERIEGCKIL